MTRAPVVRTATCLLAVALVTAWPGTAAVAHDHSLPGDSHYRSTITSVEPPVPGLVPAITGSSQSLTLTNHTNKTVLVIGYAYEDYLRITPAGVEENVASLTSSMNRSTASEAAALPPGQPNAPPHWQHVSDQPTFTWHDHRTHWMAEQPPPVVAADPERPHKVFDWAVPLTVDGEPVVIKGTLDWTGESGSGTFETALLVLAGVGSVALGVLIAYAWKRERRPAARAEHEPVDAK